MTMTMTMIMRIIWMSWEKVQIHHHWQGPHGPPSWSIVISALHGTIQDHRVRVWLSDYPALPSKPSGQTSRYSWAIDRPMWSIRSVGNGYHEISRSRSRSPQCLYLPLDLHGYRRAIATFCSFSLWEPSNHTISYNKLEHFHNIIHTCTLYSVHCTQGVQIKYKNGTKLLLYPLIMIFDGALEVTQCHF